MWLLLLIASGIPSAIKESLGHGIQKQSGLINCNKAHLPVLALVTPYRKSVDDILRNAAYIILKNAVAFI